jgi:F420-dependent oxidoreductase-like protein
MKIGLHIGRFDLACGPAGLGETLGRIAATADDAGFASLWVMDHLFQLGEQFGEVHGRADAGMLEGIATISFLAAKTRRIRLGMLVGCPLFRHPGLLVKSISTIDVLSGGRAAFGLGAGWYERESAGLGIPFPPLAERFERFEETLQIAKLMWSGSREPFNGKHYQLKEPIDEPRPLSTPHPPIVIGGGGERKTLRLTARYADAWNFVMGPTLPLPEFGVLYAPETQSLQRLDRKLAILDAHFADVGRDPREIERNVVTYVKLAPNAMSTNGIVELCGTLAERGVSHLILNVLEVDSITPIELIGRDVVPAVARL